MPLYKKAAKLEKPTALKNYLLTKNYVILATEVPVGDIVEYGLDWVVDILTLFNEGVSTAFMELVEEIESNYITLADYYDLKFTHDKEIAARGYMTWGAYFDDKFEHDKAILSLINTKVSPIRVDLDTHIQHYDVLRELVMRMYEDMDTQGISINLSLINLGAAIEGLQHRWDEHKNLFQWSWLFFSDPPLFAYELADEVLERFF